MRARSGRARRWRAGTVAVAALLVAGTAVTAGPVAGAATGAPRLATAKPGGALSPRLDALAGAGARAADAASAAATLGLPASGTGSLLRDAAGRVLTEVRVASPDAATVDALAAAGARVVHVAAGHRVVTAYVAPASLRAVGAVAGVEYAEEVLTPARAPLGAPETRGDGNDCQSVVSEGDEQLDADLAREQFHVNGNGVEVGVLSDSYDVATFDVTDEEDDVRSGDLPGPEDPCGPRRPVDVIDEYDGEGGIDEGRGMAQLVHDLAPGADLAFATAFEGMYDFADNIRALREAGADVIVDDVTYFGEPFYQDGPVSVAVNDVVADGASYFSSAGNSTIKVDGRNVASYEARAFRPAACPATLPDFAGSDCHDFDPSAGRTDTGSGFIMAPGGQLTLVLQWAEPWFGVTTDLDLYLVDAVTGELLQEGITMQDRSRKPIESLIFTNRGGASRAVELVVNRFAGDRDVRFKYLHVFTSGLRSVEYDRSVGPDVVGPSIFGHNGAERTISVGAVPFNHDNRAEPYTSQGPVTILFGPVTDDSTPAPALPRVQVLQKPDVAATDGGQTTFFFGCDEGEVCRFYGTSASAPHAAAVAALALDLRPGTTPQQVREGLQATADPVEHATPKQVGAGLVDADQFLALVATPA